MHALTNDSARTAPAAALIYQRHHVLHGLRLGMTHDEARRYALAHQRMSELNELASGLGRLPRRELLEQAELLAYASMLEGMAQERGRGEALGRAVVAKA